MMWQVRALLDDRPGALASLATSCGDQAVNILGLQIFPAADGRVVDELVLHTPGGWDATDVQQLCELAGVAGASVSPCSPHALEDQPVGYVRAAQALVERPDALEDQLCRLLGAFPGDGVPGLETLVLDDDRGPVVALTRAVPFTDTEVARAGELRRLAAALVGEPVSALVPTGRSGGPAASVPLDGAAPAPEADLRQGSVDDISAFTAMHHRCSAQTILRRYHAPVPHLSPRLARALLAPADGMSLVVMHGEEMVGAGMLTVGVEDGGTVTAELAALVEDRWQGHGYGTRLLRALAIEAANRGADTAVCLSQPGNDAVMRTIRGAGFRVRVRYVDGVSEHRINITKLRAATTAPKRKGRVRPPMGEITAPLVALLHDRRELREVYRPADLIDQAVRGGA